MIIEGARQVGKTWLMKEFGRQSYADTVYINFDSNSRMAELFASDLDTDRLIMGLELYVGHKIDPNNSLLVFDEVQEVPRALASLKYFYENAPQYHIVCAGSLLGIALHQGTSFPVGKVDFLKLYPLSFKEFLMATGKEQFAALLDSQDFQMITSFKQTYIDALKHYYFVGGMPEAVQSFTENKDFNEVLLYAMDAIHHFTLFCGHDRKQLLRRVLDRIVDDEIIVLSGLAVFPFCPVHPLFHQLRRNIAARSEPAADLGHRRCGHEDQNCLRQTLFDVQRTDHIHVHHDVGPGGKRGLNGL